MGLTELDGGAGVPAPALTVHALSFDEACARVLDFLQEHVPLGFWSITSRVDGRQLHLHVRDEAYGRRAGDWHAWSDSFCRHAVAGDAPRIAPDAMAVPAYAAAGVARRMTIGAYVGIPIRDGDGHLFGTLCGLDPRAQPPELARHQPVLELLATLLGQVLATERLRAAGEAREEALRWRALHDELTGLANRAMFLDRLTHALELHRRDRRPLAVLSIDIDDFRAVNDAFGHPGGDELLVRVAERLRGVVGDGDTLARLGSDQFAVLVEHGPRGPAQPQVLSLAERAVAALSEPFAVGRRQVGVGVSVGVAEVAAQGRSPTPTPAQVLAHADVALDSARRAGRGRAALYRPSMRLPEARALPLREPLRRALARGEVRTAFQPLVDLRTGAVTGAECLARWSHGGREVPPEVFVPLAARSNLLPALTASVLEQACAQLARWAREGRAQLRVAVNVPPELLTDPGFPATVLQAAHRHGVQPSRVVLEVTEDALLQDLDAVQDVTGRLHEAGFGLSLDDFGTGYSSLLHLRSIPLDSVKIDRGFTADVDVCPRAQQFLRALLALGRDLGLDVVVEGVERPAQEEVLRELGAVHAQGFLYGEATAAGDLPLGEVTGRGRAGGR
ncbi:putative bifunctional diguanylate cyclase/phosphodiesterase [Kineococcus indalonis]|uniref:putative bifunctional diguanylate cyclase/phosphodiesterase n=1 Tax=Kineococcus indalonis TaxID=2696566 RepID=UPI00141214FE|nr:bifunctional diguanylate cyclase/phosphodiesterase [Kineococcus indalonis]NAZ86887.1 EAL domain-containing protein [Kineococcus indalonis]